MTSLDSPQARGVALATQEAAMQRAGESPAISVNNEYQEPVALGMTMPGWCGMPLTVGSVGDRVTARGCSLSGAVNPLVTGAAGADRQRDRGEFRALGTQSPKSPQGAAAWSQRRSSDQLPDEASPVGSLSPQSWRRPGVFRGD